MSVSLTPAQEHYLKRELIRLEINDEFEQFNDAYVLRRFGFPFSPDDPKKDTAIKINKRVIGDKVPLSQFFFHEILTELPFLSADSQNTKQFWIKKVQVFYENFMSMQVSDTKDRDELTKRKKMANKVNRLFLMIFNSGIGTMNELSYFSEKNEALEKEDFKPVESTKLRGLLAPSREELKKQVNQTKFINGIHINVAGVRLVQNKSSTTKFWNTVTVFNQLQKNDNYYEFIVRSRIDLPESELITVARRYGEFKALHNKLKKKYPGKKLPSLPSKVKMEVSVDGEVIEEDDDEDAEEIEQELEKEDNIRDKLYEFEQRLKIDMYEETRTMKKSEEFTTAPASPVSIKSVKSPNMNLKSIKFPWGKSAASQPTKPPQNLENTNFMPRERMRLGLRAYLHTLLEDIEVSNCEIMKEFLFKDRILRLSESEAADITKRQNLDLLLLMNHLKFQNETYDKIQSLKQSSLSLRALVLNEENGLLSVFEELKTKEHITDLSPVLKNFFDWCKIEIAATIYQLFLGQDSSYEIFSQIKRVHSLMPYTIMINILKFTNPMSIMKAMIDLLMSNPFGGKSLLQTLFSGVLSDDIKSQNKIIIELETQIQQPLFVQRLKWFIFETNDEFELIESLKGESKEMNFDLLLTILISPRISATPEPSVETISDLLESYNEYKKLAKIKNPEDSLFVDHEKTELYSNLRQLYKLYIRNHDKEIMQQLWAQPELNLILRDLFTMFYQPLVNLFKYSHVDKAFRHFQKFMDDLIALIDGLSTEIYSLDASKVVTDIMGVLTKHEDEFYVFLQEVYNNDKDKLFEKIITWLNSILKILRIAKSKDGKFARLDMLKIISESKDVEGEELKHEVDAIIKTVTENHENIKKRYEESQNKKAKSLQSQANITENWDLINQDLEFFNYQDFGINDYDIAGLQDSKEDEDSEEDEEEEEDIHESLKNEEITKLLGVFKIEVTKVLNSYVQN